MRDETFFRTATHESGHWLAALLLTSQPSAVSLKTDGSALCYTKYPSGPGWGPNDHKYLIYDALTTAGGIASESLMLGSVNRVKASKDRADLVGICSELAGLPLYHVRVDTLTDLMESSARVLLRPHRKALDFLAHQVYDKGEWSGTDLYYRVVTLHPELKEGSYTPLLAGADWLKAWDALLERVEQAPHLMDGWRGDAARDKHDALKRAIAAR